MRKILIAAILILVFTGCGGKDSEKEGQSKPETGQESEESGKDEVGKDKDEAGKAEDNKEGFAFKSGNIIIGMNTNLATIKDQLGDPVEYFEAESCAFKGLDKKLYYNGFEVNTYPLEGEDFVSSISILDDSVATQKGIYLGSSLDDLLKAYGDNYEERLGLYTYTKGESQLSFIVEDGAVVDIKYLAIIEGME